MDRKKKKKDNLNVPRCYTCTELPDLTIQAMAFRLLHCKGVLKLSKTSARPLNGSTRSLIIAPIHIQKRRIHRAARVASAVSLVSQPRAQQLPFVQINGGIA